MKAPSRWNWVWPIPQHILPQISSSLVLKASSGVSVQPQHKYKPECVYYSIVGTGVPIRSGGGSGVVSLKRGKNPDDFFFYKVVEENLLPRQTRFWSNFPTEQNLSVHLPEIMLSSWGKKGSWRKEKGKKKKHWLKEEVSMGTATVSAVRVIWSVAFMTFVNKPQR